MALICVGAALALGVAACGGDDDESAETTTSPVTSAQAETTATSPDDGDEAEEAEDRDDPAARPVADADVTLTEFKVRAAKRSLPKEGVYRLNVVNAGETTHALEAEGPNGETETEEIPPGESATLDAYFVSGTYKLYCPIGNHEQKGMTTRLRVRG